MNGSTIQGDTAAIASYSLVGSKSHIGSPDPNDLRSLAAGKLDYQSLYDGAKLDELALANLGEAAFKRGDYEWTIKFLEQAKQVQHSKVWMGRYPYLAASYLLAKNDKAKFEGALEDMLKAMTVPFTYLYHAYPRSAVIGELNGVLALLPSDERPFVQDVIKRASAMTTS